MRFGWLIALASSLASSPSFCYIARADFNYADFGSTQGLIFNGDAGPLDGRLRLTWAGGESFVGTVYRTQPEFVAFGFSATFQFEISEPAGVGLADGLTFIIQNSPEGLAAQGSAAGGLGYAGISNSLVVEIDSFSDSSLGDPPYPHVAIHSAGRSPNGSGINTRIGGPVALPHSSGSFFSHSIRINYIPGTLSVYLDTLDNLILSVDVNLEDLLDLEQGRAWVGFTAGIGAGSANHDILNWSYVADTPHTFAFEIDPSSSVLDLEGVATITTLFPDFSINTETVSIAGQGPNSLATNYTGTIWADVDELISPSSIVFKRANIDAQVSGEWAPSWGQTGIGMTTAIANYGLTAVSKVDEIGVVAALRQERLDLTSAGAVASIAASGAFPGSTQIWTRKSVVFDQYSPQLGENIGPGPAIGFQQEPFSITTEQNGSLEIVDSSIRITLPVSVSFTREGVFGNITDRIVRVQWNCVYSGFIVAKRPLPAAEISASYVIYDDLSGNGSSIDRGKHLLQEGTGPREASFENLINNSRGIKTVAFDIQNLPRGGGVSQQDFDFRISPSGHFDQTANPTTSWASAPEPFSVTVSSGSPSRVFIRWEDRAIEDRWLRITVRATTKTGLNEDRVYYLGHLRGETSEPSEGLFAVGFTDIGAIRGSVGQTVDASNNLDIDKNGVVSFSDISAMRSNVGQQLTNITVPGLLTGIQGDSQ